MWSSLYVQSVKSWPKENWLMSVRTLLRIACLADRKSYVVIICARSCDKFTKSEIGWSRLKYCLKSLPWFPGSHIYSLFTQSHMITCTIQEIQRTKHSNTLIWSLNVKGHPRPNVIQRSRIMRSTDTIQKIQPIIFVMRSTEIPYMTYYMIVFHIDFCHNMKHSEDTAH